LSSSIDLSSLGWDDGFAASYSPYDAPHSTPARVTRVDRGQVEAVLSTGPVRAVIPKRLLAAAAEDPTQYPCTGDWVVLADANGDRSRPNGDDPVRVTETIPDTDRVNREDPISFTVEAVLPRRTAFVRAGVAKGVALGQVLAANVDIAVIAEGLWPEPDFGRIERLLALAWESGAQPVVVLTKADLAVDADQLRGDVAATAPGVDVYAISATTGDGMAALAPYVGHGRTIALLGRSGAGKSTLVNALAGTDVMATRAARSDHKGRHTTVHRELVRLPSGGMVIDTPGLRSIGLWDTEAGLDLVFADIDELAQSCRFGDCGHESEPDCAVLAAIEDGTLPVRRLESWRKLQREAAWMAARSDARLRQQRVAAWKRIHRDIRRSGQVRR
jgi:ribosome biogenesis GTPase / thiamine phosphate phosphatase